MTEDSSKNGYHWRNAPLPGSPIELIFFLGAVYGLFTLILVVIYIAL